MNSSKNALMSSLTSFLNWLFPQLNNLSKKSSILIPVPVLNRKRIKMNAFPIIISCILLLNAASVLANDNKNTVVHNMQQPAGFESLITNLYAVVNGANNLADGNMVIFDQTYSNVVDGFDARKLTNWGENFGMIRDNIVLAVEKRKPLKNIDTVYYEMSNLRSIQYKLEIQATNLNYPGLVGFLEDVFLGTKTPLDLNETTRYFFNVTATSGSSSRNRFRAVFFSIAGGTLPVSFTSIQAKAIQHKTVIQWQVSNQINIIGYQVQSSLNGIDFTNAGYVAVNSINLNTIHYEWIDATPSMAKKYYRVVGLDADGKSKLSPVVLFSNKKEIISADFKILSNPIQENQIKVNFSSKLKDIYTIRVLDAAGKVIFNGTTTHSTGSTIYSYNLPTNITNGNYFIEIIDSKYSRKVLPFLSTK